MCNGQLLRGSFFNYGFEKRVTVNFGFHKRSSVLGTKGGGIHSESQVFDAETIIEDPNPLATLLKPEKLNTKMKSLMFTSHLKHPKLLMCGMKMLAKI